eukprot:3311429-Alexandrium_andersonii.AAC.1
MEVKEVADDLVPEAGGGLHKRIEQGACRLNHPGEVAHSGLPHARSNVLDLQVGQDADVRTVVG